MELVTNKSKPVEEDVVRFRKGQVAGHGIFFVCYMIDSSIGGRGRVCFCCGAGHILTRRAAVMVGHTQLGGFQSSCRLFHVNKLC